MPGENRTQARTVHLVRLQQLPRTLPASGAVGLQRQRDQVFGANDAHGDAILIVQARAVDGLLDERIVGDQRLNR